MQANRLDDTSKCVLRALYELAQHDSHADAALLGATLGVRTADVSRVLLVLAARRLVSAERVRLTMAGLALAARLPALTRAARPRPLRAEWPCLRARDRPSHALARCAAAAGRS